MFIFVYVTSVTFSRNVSILLYYMYIDIIVHTVCVCFACFFLSLSDVSADTVLLSMLNDPHHSVRMKMAVIASSLFYRGGQPLPSQQQEKLFKDKITSKLERAGLVEVSILFCSKGMKGLGI